MTCGDMKYACVCNTDDFDRNSAASRQNSLISLSSPPCSLADAKKDEGNELYKTKNYRDALQRYSEAISEY